jgi:hypothetical protein
MNNIDTQKNVTVYPCERVDGFITPLVVPAYDMPPEDAQVMINVMMQLGVRTQLESSLAALSETSDGQPVITGYLDVETLTLMFEKTNDFPVSFFDNVKDWVELGATSIYFDFATKSQ